VATSCRSRVICHLGSPETTCLEKYLSEVFQCKRQGEQNEERNNDKRRDEVK
jgi:hypothetical protein